MTVWRKVESPCFTCFPSMLADFEALSRIRTFSSVTPAPVKMEKARDLGILKRPSSRCSVPMYWLCIALASCSAICRASLALGVKRSKGCIGREGNDYHSSKWSDKGRLFQGILSCFSFLRVVCSGEKDGMVKNTPLSSCDKRRIREFSTGQTLLHFFTKMHSCASSASLPGKLRRWS